MPKQLYTIKGVIGAGSFSDIFVAVDKEGKRAAVKFDRKDTGHRSHLQDEYHMLATLRNTPGVPKLIWYGKVDDENCILMELLGPDLSTLWKWCNKNWKRSTIIHIAIQCIGILRELHKKGIIHRDIKPQNLVVGSWPSNPQTIYLIDYGLSMQWCDVNKKPHSRRHPKDDLSGRITGTAKYCSMNAHHRDYTRRDDIISLGYVLLFFLRKGKLPWGSLQGSNTRIRNNKIFEMKKAITIKELCRNLPNEFQAYMEYAYSLTRDEEPGYDSLIKLFQTLQMRKGWNSFKKVCWEKPSLIKRKWPDIKNLDNEES